MQSKKHLILAINPGSTSTKVAVYNDTEELLSITLRHTGEELAQYDSITDQLPFRRRIVIEALDNAGVKLSRLDAVIGRGGLLKPIASGVYTVNEKMIDELRNRPSGLHASNLGAMLAYDIANQASARAFIADPVVVDELQDVARVTGLPEMERVSIFHALNQKAIARNYAESCGSEYEQMNLIVAHLGGGISVGAHQKGRVIDVNNALNGEGPFSPERAGTLPTLALAELCFSGRYTLPEVARMINGRGGLVALLGTNDVREVVTRANSDDRRARQVLDAMCYNIGKSIGQMAAVLGGEVDAVILTGGIAYNTYVCDYIRQMVSFIADVVVVPGENELEALAANALRVLEGRLVPKEYR